MDNIQKKTPFLIIGLGNPGRKYMNNRHNAGFMVLDLLAQHLGVSFSRLESNALVSKTKHLENQIILSKPRTYMNLSGQAVGSLSRYYKIPLRNILVVYDDLDLPLGALRMRPGGGSAGQRGMVSVIERLGTSDFPRLRLGVGRPPGRMPAADYLLQDFSKAEMEIFNDTLQRAVEAVLTFISDGLDTAMNKYNTRE